MRPNWQSLVCAVLVQLVCIISPCVQVTSLSHKAELTRQLAWYWEWSMQYLLAIFLPSLKVSVWLDGDRIRD